MRQRFIDVRRLLESLEETRSEVARLRRSVAYLEGRCTAGTAHYGVKNGSEGQGPEELWVSLCDQRKKLAEQEARLKELEPLLGRWIDQLPRPRWRMVLRCRYLEGLPLAEIPEVLTEATGREFSIGQVYRLHAQALGAAEDLWPVS